MTPLFAIGPARLALEPLVSAVASESDGGVAVFLGLVRNHNQGRRVQYLEYEAFEPLALKGKAGRVRRAGKLDKAAAVDSKDRDRPIISLETWPQL